MEIINQATYPIDGESYANGKQIETTVEVTYDDIYDEIYEYILEAERPVDEDLIEIDDEYIYTFPLGDWISNSDLQALKIEMDMELLDDDYGDTKHYNLVERWLTENLPSSAKDTFEVIEQR